MKDSFILPAVMLCLLVLCIAWNNKTKHNGDEIDKIQAAVANLKLCIGNNAHIQLNNNGAPNQVGFWLRFALAPAYLSMKKTPVSDTVLSVCKIADKDATIAQLQNKNILWSGSDNDYFYCLNTFTKQ